LLSLQERTILSLISSSADVYVALKISACALGNVKKSLELSKQDHRHNVGVICSKLNKNKAETMTENINHSKLGALYTNVKHMGLLLSGKIRTQGQTISR